MHWLLYSQRSVYRFSDRVKFTGICTTSRYVFCIEPSAGLLTVRKSFTDYVERRNEVKRKSDWNKFLSWVSCPYTDIFFVYVFLSVRSACPFCTVLCELRLISYHHHRYQPAAVPSTVTNSVMYTGGAMQQMNRWRVGGSISFVFLCRLFLQSFWAAVSAMCSLARPVLSTCTNACLS